MATSENFGTSKNQWELKPEPSSDTLSILMDEVRLPQPLAKILAQRGYSSYELAKRFFRPHLDDLHDPLEMKDMENAINRICKAIDNQENILIYGDYDVDGTTAVALVYCFLKSIYDNVTYYIPDRYLEGYGISLRGIDFAYDNRIGLIIALDCGIKAIDQINYATEKNIDFIICDHHLPSEKLPKAVAVLDPKRKDCNYPFKELSGCGVGFKLIQALAQRFEIQQSKVYDYLDLLVVSVAADMVPIVGENRILAHHGLRKLQETPRPGLVGLLKDGQEKMNISNIVFSLAPKINATGRLEHASQSVEILISDNEDQIKKFAGQINEINLQRKETDGNVTNEAIKYIKKNGEEEKFTTVVYEPHWHKGVLGIVASRLIDHYYRPTLVLTDGNDGEITGSARSIKDFDIYEMIDNCADLLSKYGGHRFAAGLTMPKENFSLFKEKFENLVKDKIRPHQRKPTIEIDAEIRFPEITQSFLRILRQMEPFGPENMSPVFLSKNLIGGKTKKMGKQGEHLKLSLLDENTKIEFPAVAFQMGRLENDFLYRHFDIVYTIDENHWKGNTYLQFNIRDVRFME